MTQFDTQVTRMVLAVVHSQDSDVVETELEQEGVSYAKFPSTGGFLFEKNVTFLIATDEQHTEKIVDLLSAAAKKRISYVAATMDYTPFPMIIPAETMVGGVTIFILKVDHFEEY
ncbi:MAG: cyclic-di-AMP receptor [Anaerolineaceae bacterium]|jgi:uncharacterized protein YaaQ|nr:cyclic-di-AMP receptor [Anaerolineaceae bacterium]MDD4043680.1 cyclic-di-AMP receptor [Anaerolineaceae bacterium]MDD4578053.1 cyclic-di-AMP receptor [Anaerolineaceae bacterium]